SPAIPHAPPEPTRNAPRFDTAAATMIAARQIERPSPRSARRRPARTVRLEIEVGGLTSGVGVLTFGRVRETHLVTSISFDQRCVSRTLRDHAAARSCRRSRAWPWTNCDTRG